MSYIKYIDFTYVRKTCMMYMYEAAVPCKPAVQCKWRSKGGFRQMVRAIVGANWGDEGKGKMSV